MSLPVTKLDTIDFEALFTEARDLVPRYAPEWTDHNLHDPGITLIDLLAWITDQEIFRIGFVSDRHRQAFAALLGVRPRLAIPARGLLWPVASGRAAERRGGMTVVSPRGGAVPARVLKKGTQIVSVEQPELKFLLERDVFLTDARLEIPRSVEDGQQSGFCRPEGGSGKPIFTAGQVWSRHRRYRAAVQCAAGPFGKLR